MVWRSQQKLMIEQFVEDVATGTVNIENTGSIFPKSCESFNFELPPGSLNIYVSQLQGVNLSFVETQTSQTYEFSIDLETEVPDLPFPNSLNPGEYANHAANALNNATSNVVTVFGLTDQYKLPGAQDKMEKAVASFFESYFQGGAY